MLEEEHFKTLPDEKITEIIENNKNSYTAEAVALAKEEAARRLLETPQISAFNSHLKYKDIDCEISDNFSLLTILSYLLTAVGLIMLVYGGYIFMDVFQKNKDAALLISLGMPITLICVGFFAIMNSQLALCFIAIEKNARITNYILLKSIPK